MWVKVDDGFPDHEKVFEAGQRLGPCSTGRVIAVWLEAMCWCNRKRTDGVLLREVVRAFRHDRAPLKVAAALEAARLWEPIEGGWRVHDFHQYQPTAERRAEISEARAAAGRRGAAATNGRRTDGNESGNLPGNARGNLPTTMPANGSANAATEAAICSPRYPVPEDQDQNQDQDPRPPAGRPVENRRDSDGNPAAMRRLVHELLEIQPYHVEADLKEDLKRRCAQLRIAYDADAVRVALDRVNATRARRATTEGLHAEGNRVLRAAE